MGVFKSLGSPQSLILGKLKKAVVSEVADLICLDGKVKMWA